MSDFKRAWEREIDRAERQAGRDLGKFVGGIGAQVTRGFGASGENNIQNARAYQQEAGRQGRISGRNQAYADFGGVQNDYNRGYVMGAGVGARQLGNQDGRYAVYAANAGVGAGAGQQAGYDPSVIYFEETHWANRDLKLDNQGVPFSFEQHQRAKTALIDIFENNRGDGINHLNEAEAFNVLLQNGVHPDAIITDDKGNRMTLDDVIAKEVGKKKGGEKEAAQADLDQYRAQYHQAAAVSSLAQQFGVAQAGVANGQVQAPNPQQLAQAQPQFSGAGAYVATASISEKLDVLVNREQVAGMSQAQRLQTLQTVVQGINTPAEAKEFNQFVATNPTYANNLVSLINTSGLSTQELQQTAGAMGAASAKIKALDPQGAEAAERAAQSQLGQQAQTQARERRANLSIEELEKLNISNAEMQGRLEAAIDNEKDWQSQVEQAGFFGFILQIFRSFLDDNPTPDSVLKDAVAAGHTIEAGTPEIKSKLESRAVFDGKVVLNEALAQEDTRNQEQENEQAVAANEQEQEGTKDQAQETEQVVVSNDQAPQYSPVPVGQNDLLNPDAQAPQHSPVEQANPLAAALANNGINLSGMGVTGGDAVAADDTNRIAAAGAAKQREDAQGIGS